jgi:hypothetical protein
MCFRNITKNSSKDGKYGKTETSNLDTRCTWTQNSMSTTSATELWKNDFVAATDFPDVAWRVVAEIDVPTSTTSATNN